MVSTPPGARCLDRSATGAGEMGPSEVGEPESSEQAARATARAAAAESVGVCIRTSVGSRESRGRFKLRRVGQPPVTKESTAPPGPASRLGSGGGAGAPAGAAGTLRPAPWPPPSSTPPLPPGEAHPPAQPSLFFPYEDPRHRRRDRSGIYDRILSL